MDEFEIDINKDSKSNSQEVEPSTEPNFEEGELNQTIINDDMTLDKTIAEGKESFNEPIFEDTKPDLTPCNNPKKKHTFLIVLLSVIGAIGLTFGISAIVGGWTAVKATSEFITRQILGMVWLNDLIGLALAGIGGKAFLSTWYGAGIQFFIYDTIKIFFLLFLLIFLISYIQSYFPPERTKKILAKFGGIKGNILGALLGTVTPFCSCSSIPIFIGFTKAGVRSGVTFSFLISSPLVDLGAFILLASVFGFPIAIAYVAVGLVLAVVGGTIIEKSGVGKNVQDFVLQGESVDIDEVSLTHKERANYAIQQVKTTLKRVWAYVLIGVAVGALIHNVVPSEWISAVLGQDKWYSVLVASLVGVPMYADIFGTIPVAEALWAKGVGIGTILAFMMSVTALSLPSMIMLSKAVKPKLLAAFIGVVVAGIIIIGYVFNALNFLFV